MIQITPDMIKNMNFYGCYGFLMAADRHQDYCTKDDAVDMFIYIQHLIKYETDPHMYTPTYIKQVEIDKAMCTGWIVNCMSRGERICPTI